MKRTTRFHSFIICGVIGICDFIFATDNFALMTGSLRTFQEHACDGEELRIQCYPNTVISINLVQYGRPSGQQDALCKDPAPAVSSVDRLNITNCVSQKAFEIIERKCQRQMICRLMTSPKTFQDDPCPHMRKYAEVAYKCRPDVFQNRIACEGEKMTLTCDPPLSILIYSAFYGSIPEGILECPKTAEHSNGEACESSYATESVLNICFGKQECTLWADAETFGNPSCSSSVRKHLKVVFTCVPKEVLRQSEEGLTGGGFRYPRKGVVVHTTSYPAWASNMDHDLPSYLIPHSSVSTKLNVEMQQDSTTGLNGSDTKDRKIVGLLTVWLSAHKFMLSNKQKMILYVSLSLGVGLIFFALVVFLHYFFQQGFAKDKEKFDVPPITDDDFFSDSDLEHYEGSDLVSSTTNTMTRKISEAIPRAPVSDGPQTNHFFS